MFLDSILTVCSLAYWLGMLGLMSRVFAKVPELRRLRAPTPVRWPKVSMIVPARNEADTLVPALRSKLAIPYPDLEIILVDDRSSDATPRLAHVLAQHHPQLRVVRVDVLPDGWLGKVHAMQRGVEHASGASDAWLLFCDADVHVAPTTLEQVIAYAEHQRIDHVAILPRITATDPALVCTLTTFLRQLCAGGRLWAVPEPGSSASAGVGAFNLVRRTALERAGGLSRLRMEITDDVALGRMLKRSGARQIVVNGRSDVCLAFYPSFRALTRSLEKNGTAAPLRLVLIGLLALCTLEWGLLFGLCSGSFTMVLLALGAWLCASLATYRLARWLALPRWTAIVPFLGMLPLAWALLRSSALATMRGGVQWRGTFYSKAELHAGTHFGLKGRL